MGLANHWRKISFSIRKRETTDSQSKFDVYTTLNTSREKILKKCVNMEFKESKIKNLYPSKESSETDKSKYCRFRKSYNHNTNDCIQLKDVIEGMVKKLRLEKYTRDTKRDREDSQKKKKSPKNYQTCCRGQGKRYQQRVRRTQEESPLHPFHHLRGP